MLKFEIIRGNTTKRLFDLAEWLYTSNELYLIGMLPSWTVRIASYQVVNVSLIAVLTI